MKACSKNKPEALIAVGVTAVLGIFFWVPFGSGSVALTPHLSLGGKTWILREDKPPVPAPPPPSPIPAPTMNTTKDVPSKKKTRRGTPRRAAEASVQVSTETKVGAKPTVQETPPPAASPAQVPSSPVSVKTTVLPGTLNADQEYTLQDVTDTYENDPSKYPLDKTVTLDGIAFSALGVERRDGFFVLKVAVANQTDSDFFIKDFTPQAGARVLGSRALFRILVEPQREREGYVIFEKPQSGAAVKINLKEDGGKARVLKLTVPYSF